MTDMTRRERARDLAANSWLVLRESVTSFLANSGFERAATISFYGFLSLIPLILLIVIVASRFIQSSQAALETVHEILKTILPLSDKLVLREVTATAARRGWGLVALLILVWSVTPLAASLRSAFQNVFKPDKQVPFLKAKAFDVAMVMVTLLLFVIIICAKPGYVMVLNLTPWPLEGLRQMLNRVLPFLLTVGFLMFFYRLFSPVRVKPRELLPGAFVAAALLSLMEPLFTLILHYNPAYGLTFGSLKAMFLFFVWVYYAFAAVLFGAEVVANTLRSDALLVKSLFTSASAGRTRRRLISRLAIRLNRGAIVFREGDASREMFFILSGEVALTDHGRVLRTLKTGEYFGEMAMLLDAPRSMTVLIHSDEAQLVRVTQQNFALVLRENPVIVLAILREMARRLKATTAEAVATGTIHESEPSH